MVLITGIITEVVTTAPMTATMTGTTGKVQASMTDKELAATTEATTEASAMTTADMTTTEERRTTAAGYGLMRTRPEALRAGIITEGAVTAAADRNPAVTGVTTGDTRRDTIMEDAVATAGVIRKYYKLFILVEACRCLPLE